MKERHILPALFFELAKAVETNNKHLCKYGRVSSISTGQLMSVLQISNVEM